MNAYFNLISIVGLDQNGNCHSYVDKDMEKVTWIVLDSMQREVKSNSIERGCVSIFVSYY